MRSPMTRFLGALAILAVGYYLWFGSARVTIDASAAAPLGRLAALESELVGQQGLAKTEVATITAPALAGHVAGTGYRFLGPTLDVLVVADAAGVIQGINVGYSARVGSSDFPYRYWRSVTGAEPSFLEVVTVGLNAGRHREAKQSDPAYYARWVDAGASGEYSFTLLKR